MISFIVIGRNEGAFLKKCFESILYTIHAYHSLEYEIVYVDSNSTDNSIEIANEFATRIILLSGECSAAIGRNVGAAGSQGESLIFLDGDMEIQTKFFQIIIDSDGNMNFPFVSGDLLNIYFDESYNFINQSFSQRKELINDKYTPRTGGFFCIKKNIWLSAGGMQEKFRICEDLDFGFRLAKRGFLLLRKKELSVKHNTISYFEKNRMKKIIINNDFGFRAVLYRDHILNKNMYYMLFRTDYSFLLLIITCVFSAIVGHFEVMLLYILAIIIRALFQSSSDKISRLKKMLFIIIKDLQMMYSLFLFYPRNKKLYNVKIIK